MKIITLGLVICGLYVACARYKPLTGTVYAVVTKVRNTFLFFPFPLRTSQSPGSGKRHLLHLARPQDRSGGPTKGAKLTGGNLPDCRLRADSPFPFSLSQRVS
ncbi:MAG: hypothetical protein ACHBN1_02275 [Heteroscytonema crispum UTEX LB 1556]